jgi:hypothetical protein
MRRLYGQVFVAYISTRSRSASSMVGAFEVWAAPARSGRHTPGPRPYWPEQASRLTTGLNIERFQVQVLGGPSFFAWLLLFLSSLSASIKNSIWSVVGCDLDFGMGPCPLREKPLSVIDYLYAMPQVFNQVLGAESQQEKVR